MTVAAAIMDLEFDPQLGTSASGLSVNHFVRAHDPDVDGVNLILRPPFQRNLVWNPTQQAFLIDSILRGLPVPELYVQIKTTGAGDEEITVVDGQQRLSACLAFIDGSLELGDSDEFDPRWKGRRFSQLEDALKSRFRSFEFIVRKLPSNSSVDVLREIFRRLNRTVEVLQPQELRHAAFTGPFIQLVERAASAAFLRDLGVFTPVDYRRRRSDEFVAEVLFAMSARAFPNKKDGLDGLFLTFERQGMPEDARLELEARFGRVAHLMDRIAGDLKKTRFRNKSDAYSLLTYLALQAESLDLDDTAIAELVRRAKEFSGLVNGMKRREAAESSIDDLVAQQNGRQALSYLRAVERAASDRLNRVRRSEALATILGDLFEGTSPKSWTHEDGEWLLAVDDEPEEDSEDDSRSMQETQGVQAALLSGAEGTESASDAAPNEK